MDLRVLKMKKYHQLLLLILSLLSLVALLFYRHEYNKLRYVMEVLNFFGTPGVSPPAGGSCLPSDNKSELLTKLKEPHPSWQRVSNTLFIYSAFWDKEDERYQVKALALGTLNENLNYDCFLWFEEFEEPVKGQFSFSAIPRNDKQSFNTKSSKAKGYLFFCDPKDENAAPYGVTFYKTNNNDAAFIPVVNVNKDKSQSLNSTGVCVFPMEGPEVPKSTYLEFLSYYQVQGVNEFIIYGGEFIHNILNSLEDPQYNIYITALQWNYPFLSDLDLMKSIIEIDCVLRTRGIFENVILLHWQQFVVPRFHSELHKLISDLDVNKNYHRFQLTPFLFCLEYKDDPKSEVSQPTPLRKTRYTLLKSEIPIYIYKPFFKLSDKTHIQKVSKEIVVVHWYTKCNQFDLKIPEKKKNVKNDYSFFKFNGDFLRSKILKLPSYS